MKSDVLLYEKIYQILKNKIECGLLPNGLKLPARADLCKEFNTSEKTVRRVIKILEMDGLLETAQRKRPVVTFPSSTEHKNVLLTLQRASDNAVNDILKTGILLCYPLNSHGMALCRGADWDPPEAIVETMNPENPHEFWRLSNSLWRYFIARNENELILRAVDSLGFSELDPLPGTPELRQRYQTNLKILLRTMKSGGRPQNVHFDDMFALYGFLSDENGKAPVYNVMPDSPLCLGSSGLKQRLRKSQERYSSVYLDLLGRIAIGKYRPGDRLPSHKELHRIYQVSIDTTIKAIHTLQDWGVVTVKRGKGIFVAMDISGLKKIHFEPEQIAHHVRRFLDSLELLSLTVEGVAVHIASHVTPEETRALLDQLESLWNGKYLYQVSPFVLLEFIVKHIEYDALRAIYEVVLQNQHIGQSIPKLVNRAKTPTSCEIYRQCVESANLLAMGQPHLFAQKAAAMFQRVRELVIEECKRLHYWEPAMCVYDGTALWK